MRKIMIVLQYMGKFVPFLHMGNNTEINTLAEFNGQTTDK